MMRQRSWNASLHAMYVVETGLFSSLPADNTVEIMYSVLEKGGQNQYLKRQRNMLQRRGHHSHYT
ncbi:MAG: hypothetical protein MZV63_46100 [Marinilabiliales bacterium]|nr:hypothetical protein [Marinilabiliales bacterium]